MGEKLLKEDVLKEEKGSLFEMLPQQNRLFLRKDFAEIKKKGEKFQGRFFGLLVYIKEGNFPRFGFIVSNRISKRATARNRVKRLLREAAKSFLTQMKPGRQILFLAKKEILGEPLSRIKEEAEKIFQKAKILKSSDEK